MATDYVQTEPLQQSYPHFQLFAPFHYGNASLEDWWDWIGPTTSTGGTWRVYIEHYSGKILRAHLPTRTLEFLTIRTLCKYMANFTHWNNIYKGWWGTVTFFFLSFWSTHVFWGGGPLVPLFWISDDVSSVFQSQSGLYLICFFCWEECNVHSLRSIFGATCANLLVATIAAGHFPTCISRGRTWLGSPGLKTNVLPLCQRPCFGTVTINLCL